MQQNKIPFNKPKLIGLELDYIKDSVLNNHISGDGKYTKLCSQLFSNKFNINTSLLTTSCTDALELSALLLDIKDGDEVIMPSYTFVSTANAFALRGAKIIFVDSYKNNPNIDSNKIENFITDKTKAIVVVHYAGIACDMDKIMSLSRKYNLKVIEDAAQAIDSFHNGVQLGTIGDLGTFSFHETKNIVCGEGGLISINDTSLFERAEIMREKGTNRSSFFRGDVDKYGWVDIGSSFLPSDILAAYLFGQLEFSEKIQSKRKEIWNRYYKNLNELEIPEITIPNIPNYATQNGHLFYIVTENLSTRDSLIKYLRLKGIHAVFHYQSLHKSAFFKEKFQGDELINSEKFSNCLIRLPLYYDLEIDQVDYITNYINEYFKLKIN